MKTKPLPSCFCILFAALLLLPGVSALADFPPVLVIDGTAYTGYMRNNGTEDCMVYYPGGGVLVLHGNNGGEADWGDDEDAAFQSPTVAGTWNGGLHVYLDGHNIAVPQILLYYNKAYPYPPALKCYDGNWISPDGYGISDRGSSMAAYTGIHDGDIFSFLSSEMGESPAYRYVCGPNPDTIDSTSGWPPGGLFSFPSRLYVNGSLLEVSGASESVGSGYTGDAYYQNETGDVTAALHVYIDASGTTGTMWGYADGADTICAAWDPITNIFVADPGIGISIAPPSGGPAYGPPMITWDGALLKLKYKDTQGSDVYAGSGGPNGSNPYRVIINHGLVTGIDCYGNQSTGTYNAYAFSQTFANQYGHMAAVSADGNTMLGLPKGVLVNNVTGDPGFNWGYHWYNDWGTWPQSPDYSLYRANGSAAFKYTSLDSAGVACFSFSASPCYYGYFGNDLAFDVSQSLPVSNLPPLPVIPSTAYINGVSNEILSSWYAPKGPAERIYYRSWASASIAFWYDPSVAGYVSGDLEGTFLSGPVSITSLADAQAKFQQAIGPGSSLTFAPPPAHPSFGPPQIAISGHALPFCYNDGEGNDVYADSGFFQGISVITISSSGQVGVWGDWMTLTSLGGATYDPATFTFSSPWTTSSGNILNLQTMAAVGAIGGLLATMPAGIEVRYNAPPATPVTPLMLADGSVRDLTNSQIFTYPRGDGSWAVKYIPSSNSPIAKGSLFAFGDGSGHPLSPTYIRNRVDADVIVDMTSGTWPATNIYPPHIYVNGQFAALDNSTLYDTNESNTWGGGVAYELESTGDTIWIEWTFANSFSAIIFGSYGTTGFIGNWDGITQFLNLPAGLVISTQPPPGSIRYGPPQVLWNGVQLLFNSTASSLSAGNPKGGDVYRGATLGGPLTVIVNSDGSVAAFGADGTESATGTYDPSTHQFVMSTGAAVITATDSNGVALASSGGTGIQGSLGTSGQTTDILGNLDVHGNLLTLGGWTNSAGQSVAAFNFAYSASQGDLFNFATTRQTVNWIWSHSNSNGGEKQIAAMELDAANRILLFSPVTPPAGTSASPSVILAPGGRSRFDGPVRIMPQGDLDMGPYMAEPPQ